MWVVVKMKQSNPSTIGHLECASIDGAAHNQTLVTHTFLPVARRIKTEHVMGRSEPPELHQMTRLSTMARLI